MIWIADRAPPAGDASPAGRHARARPPGVEVSRFKRAFGGSLMTFRGGLFCGEVREAEVRRCGIVRCRLRCKNVVLRVGSFGVVKWGYVALNFRRRVVWGKVCGESRSCAGT